MGENKENKKSRFKFTESMLVMVNRDFNRSYAAIIRLVDPTKSMRNFTAKCKLRNSTIISSASDKTCLSTNMDELATIVEDRFFSGDTPPGSFKVAGLISIPN
jgi:hypothetical protein